MVSLEDEGKALQILVLFDIPEIAFLLNQTESHLIPTQKDKWLGPLWDMSHCKVNLPTDHILSLSQKAHSFIVLKRALRQ